ncbi:NAD-dependent protein deacetylase [Rhodoluna lacicola]|jgi:NAD-dependent SIR2 family protein deacetylase|uniref:protein acetyllysine N-acetyltransferase n=1 Tax=Rhodoluna lacicola TaxID=529884 RepID=A0A060JCP3_9MICO|nr:NAD-dependent protein deacetylase [Rhodoluna lacicola]AIC47616.1 NAD-dependent protein deacetylase, SIR2 family [Rhodoluna lacicola]BDS50513.1 NAD-dependent protein deacetylase [Rhodoluna lacicola]
MSERETLSAAAQYGVDFAREKLIGKKVLVLSGAGLSTDSGIPDYRGAGRVARHPMTYDTFMGSKEAQIRYWARSFIGWNRIAEALPNAGHLAIARAEVNQKVFQIITQNVDQLHQKAGSRQVIDLHGRLDRVRCMKCGDNFSRTIMDELLSDLNPGVDRSADFEFTPDGDAEIEAAADFKIPVCLKCGGVLKPDVVFFGESVPPQVVELAMKNLDDAEALLVAGTSLSVNSGLRFARRAARANKPIVIVNIGATRADELATAKIEANTSLVLERLFLD